MRYQTCEVIISTNLIISLIKFKTILLSDQRVDQLHHRIWAIFHLYTAICDCKIVGDIHLGCDFCCLHKLATSHQSKQWPHLYLLVISNFHFAYRFGYDWFVWSNYWLMWSPKSEKWLHFTHSHFFYMLWLQLAFVFQRYRTTVWQRMCLHIWRLNYKVVLQHPISNSHLFNNGAVSRDIKIGDIKIGNLRSDCKSITVTLEQWSVYYYLPAGKLMNDLCMTETD